MEQQEEFTDIGTVANESIHGSESPAASLAAADVDGGAVGNDDAPGSSDAGVPAERAAARSWVSPLQPPEDCIQVTPDGGVLKRVIKVRCQLPACPSTPSALRTTAYANTRLSAAPSASASLKAPSRQMEAALAVSP